MSQALPKTPAVDYFQFAFDEWTPGRVKFCLMHWPVLREAVHNGCERADWPPSFGAESSTQLYPKNMSILATAADMHLALRKLPPKQAVALYAYYRFDWTQARIAAHLGCSQPTAHRELRRGERNLIRVICGA